MSGGVRPSSRATRNMLPRKRWSSSSRSPAFGGGRFAAAWRDLSRGRWRQAGEILEPDALRVARQRLGAGDHLAELAHVAGHVYRAATGTAKARTVSALAHQVSATARPGLRCDRAAAGCGSARRRAGQPDPRAARRCPTRQRGRAAGRRDDARVDETRRACRQRRQHAVLREAQQLGLQLGRHLADLVEEQRPPLGLLEDAGFASPPASARRGRSRTARSRPARAAARRS